MAHFFNPNTLEADIGVFKASLVYTVMSRPARATPRPVSVDRVRSPRPYHFCNCETPCHRKVDRVLRLCSSEEEGHVTGSQGLKVKMAARLGSLVRPRKSQSVHDFLLFISFTKRVAINFLTQIAFRRRPFRSSYTTVLVERRGLPEHIDISDGIVLSFSQGLFSLTLNERFSINGGYLGEWNVWKCSGDLSLCKGGQ